MSFINYIFHTGVPYLVVSLFFVVYSIKVYFILKKIEENTRIPDREKKRTKKAY